MLIVFGLAIGFIEHLQIVATSNCSANANSHSLQFTTARTNSSHSAMSSAVVSGNGFQRRRTINLGGHGFKSSLAVDYLTAAPELN
jgi:hypothetical protein